MSDQPTGNVSAPQPGQAAQPSITEVGAGTQPQYVTLQEAQRIAKEEAANAYRMAQSLVDKGSQKVSQRLEEVERHIKLQEKAGMPLTPEAADRLRNEAFREAMATSQPSGQAPAQSAPAVEATDPSAAVNEAIREMEAEHGISIAENDPEAKIVMEAKNRGQLLRQMDKALMAKKVRLATAQANPEARIPGLTAGGAQNTDLHQEYLNKVQKLPPGSEEVFQLRREYREKGLNL